MLRDALERLERCFAGDPTRQDTAEARECVAALCRAERHHQGLVIEQARRGLERLGHPEPRAWFFAVALQALSEAAGGATMDRGRAWEALGWVARLMSLNDALGSAWRLVRVDGRGALIQAESCIAPGPYAVASASGRVEGLDYRVPSLELWWRAGGVVWVCTGVTRRPRGGMFEVREGEEVEAMALVGALLGLSGRREGVAPGLGTQVRAWRAARRRQGALPRGSGGGDTLERGER